MKRILFVKTKKYNLFASLIQEYTLDGVAQEIPFVAYSFDAGVRFSISNEEPMMKQSLAKNQFCWRESSEAY